MAGWIAGYTVHEAIEWGTSYIESGEKQDADSQAFEIRQQLVGLLLAVSTPTLTRNVQKCNSARMQREKGIGSSHIALEIRQPLKEDK
ncbi:MAG: hypothetical protein CEE40_06515 [Chloroflexi bacterium B3_Chlor]|nr:MAG: hypothetical protein CEE40_06515 [Chloroflexi bacterium B3_Chlor]